MKLPELNVFCLCVARPTLHNLKLGLVFHYPTKTIAKALLPKAAKVAGIPVSEYRNLCNYKYLIMDIDDACANLVFEFKQMIKTKKERADLVQDFIKLYGYDIETFEKMIKEVNVDVNSGSISALLHFSLGIPNQLSPIAMAGIKVARTIRALIDLYEIAFEEIYADAPADKKPRDVHDHVRDFVLRQQKRNSKKAK